MSTLPKWIGFAGHGEAGKSEATKFVQRMFGYERLHVKDFLAESVHPILLRYGVPQEELWNYTHGDKINLPLPGNSDLTARKLLQVQGGEFLQETDPDMMSKFWCDEAERNGGKFVNESIRYPRECAYYRERGMFVIRIVRPGHEPSYGSSHMSEADQDFPVDATIVNDGTLLDLRKWVSTVISSAKSSAHKIIPILINGRSRSGKDEFVNQFRAASGALVVNVSSIDGVREMLRSAGVDIDQKTPEQREAMVYVGDFLEAQCEFKSRWSVDQVFNSAEALVADSDVFAFIHVREPDMMHKISQRFAERGVKARSLFIDRPSVVTVDTQRDDVKYTDYPYTWIVRNAGTLDDLYAQAKVLHELIVAGVHGIAVTYETGEYALYQTLAS